MILISIGLPSRFAEWCDALVVRLATSSFETAEAAGLNSLEELAAAVLKTKAARLVVSSRQPVIRLQTAIVDSGRPFLAAVGDPRAAMRDLVQRARYDLVEATRAVASSCAAILALARAPQALVLSAAAGADQTAAARAIADHFDLPIEADAIVGVLAELCAAGLTPEDTADNAWWTGLSERDRAIVNGALLPFDAYLSSGVGLEPFVWEPELFFVNDGSHASEGAGTARLVDITGRPRFVVYGPYINLPPGAWTANIVLGFSAETAGMSFMIEIFAGRQLSHTRIEPAAEQIIETNLSFVIDHAVDQPIQIRIVNERAAFDGRLALGYVTIAPQPEMRPEARDRLAAALRQ